MKKVARDYSAIEHSEMIVRNGETHIPSVFIFKGVDKLFAFLYACEAENCTAVFENEDIRYCPHADNATTDLKLTVYMAMASNPEIPGAYMRYLLNRDEMVL